jgi:hypothetical protein
MAVFNDMPRGQKAAGGLRSGGVLAPNKADINAHLFALFAPGFVAPYPDAWFEIAFGHPDILDGAVNAAATFLVFELEQAADFAEEKNAAGFNMYVSVALRHGDRPSSGRAKDEHVTTAAKSWAEFDGEGDAKRVRITLRERDLRPSITVITGRTPHLRAHLYFGLDSAPTPEKLRAANTSLMKLLGSDAVHNISRVMRLGGTISRPTQDKRDRGYVDEMVTLHVHKNAPAYRIDDLIGLAGEASGSKSNGHEDHRDGGRTEAEIIALLKLSQLSHEWHNAILRAIASMIGYGWSDAAIKMACAPYCIDEHKDEDLTPMIAGARAKGWDRPGVAAKPEQSSIHGWDDPDWSLLDNRRGDLPHFPLDTLAQAWQDLLLRTAHGAGVLPEHVIVPLLGIASSLIGTARRVRAAKAWSEPFSMWACVVADSGDRKTPGLRVTTRALDMIEKNNSSEVTKKRLTHETRAQNAKEVLKKWKIEREAAVNACPPQEPPTMPVEAIDPGTFIEPRLYSNDPTIERLSSLLRVKPRGTMLIRDELAGLFANMSRYSGGSDRPFWLEAWNGGRHIVERQSGSTTVEHLLIGVVGGFQPDKLSRAFDGDEDGMYGRFFYAWLSTPDYKPLSKDADEFEPALINALTHLIRLPAEDAEEGTFAPVDVWLSDEAIEVFEDFRKWSDATKRSLCGREQQWFVKGETNVLRLAGTLAYMAWAIIKSDPGSTGFTSIVGHLEPKTIDKKFMEDAIRIWKDFFWPHAKAVLRQIGLSDRHKNARTALNWIKAHGLKEVSREEIRRHALGQKLDAEDTQRQIEGLEKSGWLRKTTTQTAGRSKHRWEVNPKIFAG